MIDAEVEINITVACDQCKTQQTETQWDDPWSMRDAESVVESFLDGLVEDGWEIEDESALCPDCVEAREDGEEPLDPYRNNGGIAPQDGIGLKLFDDIPEA